MFIDEFRLNKTIKAFCDYFLGKAVGICLKRIECEGSFAINSRVWSERLDYRPEDLRLTISFLGFSGGANGRCRRKGIRRAVFGLRETTYVFLSLHDSEAAWILEMMGTG